MIVAWDNTKGTWYDTKSYKNTVLKVGDVIDIESCDPGWKKEAEQKFQICPMGSDYRVSGVKRENTGVQSH